MSILKQGLQCLPVEMKIKCRSSLSWSLGPCGTWPLPAFSAPCSISCCSHHPPIHYTGINREAVELSDLLCLRIFAFAFPPSRIFPFSSYASILLIFYSMQIYTRFLPNTPSFPWPSSLGVFYSNAVFPSLWKQGTLAHI